MFLLGVTGWDSERVEEEEGFEFDFDSVVEVVFEILWIVSERVLFGDGVSDANETVSEGDFERDG